MRRITFLCGHYGSGKSEIAVNLAIDCGIDYLVDLDVINPYFRSRSVHERLAAEGVTLVESSIEKAPNSDLPVISAKGAVPFHDKSLSAIYDLGGTREGAKLVQQYRHLFAADDAVDFLVVVNVFRPETTDAEKIHHLIDTLETAADLKATGLINNSNLIKETRAEHIEKGEAVLTEVASARNIPIRYTFHEESVPLKGTFSGETRLLRRYLAKKWL